MQISKLNRFLTLVVVGAGVALQSLPARAFDASKIIQNDTSSSKVFEFFFTFKNQGKSEEAFEVLQYAAENGNAAAQWKLAKILQKGDGVETDHLTAFSMYQRIAEQYPFARPNTPDWQFSADALVQLGDYYQNGISDSVVKIDRTKAQMMYTTAAMVFRHPDAQFKLGQMQLSDETGFGKQRLGIRNLSLAFQKGHVGAEALLGYSIFEGEYLRQNSVRGLMMLANAERRAEPHEKEWISKLYDEAFSLASPEDRQKAREGLELMIIPTK